MIVAQSLGNTAMTAVPVAALTTVLLGFAMAHWLARRQEFGKARAAAEIALRTRFLALRSQAEYTYATVQSTSASNYDPQFLRHEAVFDFLAVSVERAQALSGRQQRKVRAALVDLCGEDRVRMAEDVGVAVRQAAPAGAGPEEVFQVFLRLHWYTAHRMLESGTGFQDGLLNELDMAQRPYDVYPRVVEALDRLLSTVGTQVGLSGRKPLVAGDSS
ncbi:hypothetical protein [Streptomyces sp. NPDC052811]|uniref:hypothetical protein n=1 Tax=Streptomyces sp. NPDC052811 TaxID=3155731 RepID=UPI00343458F6